MWEPYSIYLIFFLLIFILALQSSFAGNSGRLTWVRLQQPKEQRYPFQESASGIFVCPKAWLPMLGIFNVHIDANACNYIRGLYGHHKRVCTES